MAESTGQLEDVHRSRHPQLNDRLVERPIQIDEISGNVVAAKQRARQEASPVEDLVGKFAAQHQIVGDAFARLFFRQPVERLDAGRGEREQVAVITAVHGEGVAVLGAGRRNGGDGVGDRHIPRQTGALGVWRIGNRLGMRHGLAATAIA